jgi:hypothetical protein
VAPGEGEVAVLLSPGLRFLEAGLPLVGFGVQGESEIGELPDLPGAEQAVFPQGALPARPVG